MGKLNMKERAMLREIQRLQKAGTMPTLQELTAAILETRKEFAVKIRRARREARQRVVADNRRRRANRDDEIPAVQGFVAS